MQTRGWDYDQCINPTSAQIISMIPIIDRTQSETVLQASASGH